MPILQVHLLQGRTQEQKRALVQALTEAVVQTLGTDPQTVRILLSEMSPAHYAIGGRLMDEDLPGTTQPPPGSGPRGR